MILPGETEAGSAGMQPCRGIAWWAHRDDDRERGSSPLALFQNCIGSKDPHALKIPARRAECSLTGNILFPLHAEPRHEQGRWPDSYDRLWENLIKRNGKLSGTREMVELLLLGRERGYRRLEQAVVAALQMGSSDVAAVRYLMMTNGGELAGKGGAPIRLEASDLGALIQYERPLPSVQQYDRLLGWEVIQ